MHDRYFQICLSWDTYSQNLFYYFANFAALYAPPREKALFIIRLFAMLMLHPYSLDAKSVEYKWKIQKYIDDCCSVGISSLECEISIIPNMPSCQTHVGESHVKLLYRNDNKFATAMNFVSKWFLCL